MARSGVGYYGKLPSRGDFVSRGADDGFVADWDRFARAGLADARAALGEAFEPRYLDAPAWAAALPAGVFGAHAWLLLTVPSADAAGRYFPLTAVWLDPAANAPPTARLFLARAWFERVEAALQAALDPQSDPDRLAERLAEIAPPYGEGDRPQTAIPLDWAEAGASAAFAAPGPHAELALCLGVGGATADTGARSVWSARQPGGRLALAFDGPPPAEAWRAFLQAGGGS